jgi:hypothetical protein
MCDLVPYCTDELWVKVHIGLQIENAVDDEAYT